MADELAVFLSLLLDKTEQQKTERGLADIEDRIESLDQTTKKSSTSMGREWDALNTDFAKFTTQFDARFKRVNDKLIDVQTGAKASAAAIRDFSKIDVNAPTPAKSVEEMAKFYEEDIRQAELLNKEIEEMGRLFKMSESDIEILPDHVFKFGQEALQSKENIKQVNKEVALLNRQSTALLRTGTVLSVAGAAVVAAYTGFAKKYVGFIEESGIKNDEVANRWIAASKRIDNATLNIGRSAATALIPVLEQAATLIEKVANIVQQNPEAVKNVLRAGVGASIIGALAIAVSKGIKIYADLKFIAATVAFDRSVNKFLAATASPLGGKGVGGAAGKATGILGKIGLVAIGTAIAYGINQALNEAIAGTRLGSKISEAQKSASETGRGGYPGINTFSRAAADADSATEGLNTELRDYEAEANAAAEATRKQTAAIESVKVLQKLEADNAAADARFAQERASIYANSRASIQQAGRQLNQTLEKIDNDLGINLAKMAQKFGKSNLEAEEQFQEQRRKTLQQANERVRSIREQQAEALRKLEEGHAERVDELTRDRDALGLVKEQRRFEKEKAELSRRTQMQIAETRRSAKIQLAEQRRTFIEQQNERREEYALQVAEARMQAEQARQEAEVAHEQQVKEIQTQRAQQLADLRRQHQEERNQRMLQARQTLLEINGVLGQEREMKHRYYQAMLTDAQGFMAAYFRTLSLGGASAGTTVRGTAGRTATTATSTQSSGSFLDRMFPNLFPKRQSGGYVGRGVYELHDKEFVLNARTTKMLENMIGGRLSQQNVMGSARGGGVTWNDERRFYAGVKPEERRMITDDTMEILAEAIGG